MISSISIKDLAGIIHTSNIIDIRSTQSYNNNHIPGAINIPMEKLIATPKDYLNPSTKYFIYCRQGISSLKTCKILSRLGYKVVNINGGYEEWILEN